MAHVIQLDISEVLLRNASKQASLAGKTLEEFTLDELAIINDPLILQFGTLQCNVPDLFDNHDHYIAESISDRKRTSHETLPSPVPAK